MKVQVSFDINTTFDGRTITLNMPSSLSYEQINEIIEEFILGEIVRYEVKSFK